MMLLFITNVAGQVINASITVKVDVNGKYLFYQHAGLVSERGDNAINQSVPEWGPYEFSNILDSLQKQGFNVISEIRPKDIDDSVFVSKISKQIDSLLKAGLRPERIMVVGASSGWNIT